MIPLLGSSKLAQWQVFENTSKSILEQILSVHVYGLGECQGAFFITHSDEVYNVGFKAFGSRSQEQRGGETNVPVKIEGLSHRKIVKIRVGLDYGIAVSRSGTLYHWGRPVDEFQCYGRTLAGGNDHSPHQLVGFCHVAKEVVCGESFFAVLTDNRQVFVTGWIHWNDKFYDKKLISPDGVDIASISCGAQHIAMVTVDGQVFTCGWGGDGQLGYPWKESDGYISPQKVSLPEPTIQSACGRNSTIFLNRFGFIWACGWNDNFSRLGVTNSEVIVERPLQVQSQGSFKEIASSYWSTCSVYAALSSNESSVFKWGHGCWPSSSTTLETASMLDAFLDFPTPHNLGFSELPADDTPTSTFKHGSDFDCYVLSTPDILFEGFTYPCVSNDCETPQSTDIVSTKSDIPEESTTCQCNRCNVLAKEPLHISESNYPNIQEITLLRTELSHMTSSSNLSLASLRVNTTQSLKLFLLALILFLNSLLNSNLISETTSSHHADSNIDYTHPSELLYTKLTRNSKFTDITFNLSDGVLSAHKIVLFTKNERFQQILLSNETLSIINFPQYKVRIFGHFIDYLYTRNLAKLDIKSLLSLHELSRNFNDFSLFNYTLHEIKLQLSSSSMRDVLKQAHETSSVELREIAFDYLTNQISKSEMIHLIESLVIQC